MSTEIVLDTLGARGRERNARLRDLVQKHCLEAGGAVNLARLRNSVYVRFGRQSVSSIIAFLAILAFLPVMCAIALAIKIDTPGPVFFVQKRTGYLGRRFHLFKFRTMVVDAEAMKAQLRHKNVFGKNSPDFKLIDDPRITRIGRFLRRTSLDELPNLFNVLVGDMALVGPRPTSFPIETYHPHHFPRLAISPGITGLWQISGRADVDFDERTRLDVTYINSASLVSDVWILYRTVSAVAGGQGAY